MEHTSEEEKNIIENVVMFYKAREKDYFYIIVSEAKFKATHGGKGLKVLTSKQMLLRLLITFAQVKAGNISENLVNKIRQTIFSLYQAKEITKKV